MFSELQLHQIFERWIAILKWIINAITQYQPKKKNTEKKWNENPKSTTGSGYFFLHIIRFRSFYLSGSLYNSR